MARARRLRSVQVGLVFLLLFLPLVSVLPARSSPTPGAWPLACSTELFFSEYVEGSSYNKALEIVNSTGAAVDLGAGNYDVQIFFNGNPNAGQTIPLSGTVNDGDVFVIAHPSANSAILAQADQTDGGILFNGDDAVALRKNGVYVDVIGQIGFDPGSQWGSGDLSTQDNTIRRKETVTAGDPDGSDDFEPELIAEWDGYPNDTFDGLGSHTVQCGEVAPYVASTNPANGASGVAANSNITINFNEPVNVVAPWFAISCGGSGSHSATVSGGPQSFTLNPDSDFWGCERCTVTVLASQVNDQDLDDPPNYMESDYAFSFSTACACSTIPEIQGFGSASPCEGQTVSLSGCVTGVAANGFYIQDLTGDGNPATSDGIYVYMYSTWANPENITVGRTATVSNAQVQEYYDATELYAPSSVSRGGLCTLPAPVTVQQIDTLGDHDVNRYETVEFMRVQMDLDGFVQGPTKRFASRFAYGDPEIGLLKWGLEGSLPNPPRLFEDDYAGAGPLNFLSGACNKDLPDVDWGDRIQATGLVGIMGYHYDKWQLILDESQAQDLFVTDETDISDSENPFAADEFGLCTFNLENLFDYIDDGDGDIGDWTPADATEYNAMLALRAQDIVNGLQSCTVIGVQEVEGKEQVWNDLEAAIETAGGPGTNFEWDYWESWDGRDITVGVLYDANRVTLVSSEQRQKCTTTDYGISWASVQPPRRYYSSDPCAGGTYPLFSRPPYVARLQVTGGPELTILVNHFKSKLGGEEATRTRREAQAQHNADLAWEYSGVTPNVVIMGDLNDGINTSPIAILNNATTQDGQTLVNVHLAHIPQSDRYTYIFNGQSGVLDYMFLSKLFDDYVKLASPLHINADWADLEPGESDNCGTGSCTFLSDPRSSDHDPLFVRMGLSPTRVRLISLSARPVAGGVQVRWETTGEWDNLGFHLYRSTARETLGERLNEALIPSRSPGGGAGASYAFTDTTARPGVTYYYTLEDVDGSGLRTPHGPLKVHLWAAYLPMVRR